jgi:hypothetical protein
LQQANFKGLLLCTIEANYFGAEICSGGLKSTLACDLFFVFYFFNCFSFIFAVFIFFERGEHATIAWKYSAIQAEHHHHHYACYVGSIFGRDSLQSFGCILQRLEFASAYTLHRYKNPHLYYFNLSSMAPAISFSLSRHVAIKNFSPF